MDAHFAVEASVVYACQATSEQEGWGAVGNAPDANGLGGQVRAEQVLIVDVLGQQTDLSESLVLEAAALAPAVLGTWPKLGLV